jgi:hypothetical protein
MIVFNIVEIETLNRKTNKVIPLCKLCGTRHEDVCSRRFYSPLPVDMEIFEVVNSTDTLSQIDNNRITLIQAVQKSQLDQKAADERLDKILLTCIFSAAIISFGLINIGDGLRNIGSGAGVSTALLSFSRWCWAPLRKKVFGDKTESLALVGSGK